MQSTTTSSTLESLIEIANRLALRWHARFCDETPGVDLGTGRLVLDLLTAIGGAHAVPVARALRELIAFYDDSLAEPLQRWEVAQAAAR